MVSSEDLLKWLQAELAAIPLIDTHEHIPDEKAIVGRESSLFNFFEHYVSSDLVSAGMSRESLGRMRDMTNGLTLEERWGLMAPYWPFARTTGYGKAMVAYMRDLFGIDDLNEDTCLDLCERIRQARVPGWYETVLKKANIDVSLVITWPGQPVRVDQRYFRAVPILDHYAIAATRADLAELEKQSGCSIQTLAQLLNAMEAKLDEFVAQGIVAVKLFLAYRRTLHFERVDSVTAARCFDRLWLSSPQDLSFDDLKPLQDHVIRHLIGLATDRGLPIQVHTGLQEGNGNYITNSNPTHLTNLFMEFGDARFDLFHAGFPYTGELAALAKYFPNVCANLCWVPAISPRAMAETLDLWLETIPSNKIFAVGGDSNYVEGAYGHCRLARRIVGEVLARKVESGYFAEDEAVWVGRRVLRENAAAFYGLGKRD
jgi:uncharacterized protein